MIRILLMLFLLFSVFTPKSVNRLLPTKTIYDKQFTKGDIIKLPEIVFELSYPLGKMAKDSLQLVSAFLKNHPELNVEIGCHTDQRGSEKMNKDLSTRRVKLVWEVIVEALKDSTRITYKGYGESFPIFSEKQIELAPTEEGRELLYALNRRTELKVIDIVSSK